MRWQRKMGVAIAVLLGAACSSTASDRVITATSTSQGDATTTSTSASPPSTTEQPAPVTPETSLVPSAATLFIDAADVPFDGPRLVAFDGMELRVEGVGFVADGEPLVVGLCLGPISAGTDDETFCGPVGGLDLPTLTDDGAFVTTITIPQIVELWNPDEGGSVDADCREDPCVLVLSPFGNGNFATWPLDFIDPASQPPPVAAAAAGTTELTLNGELVGPEGLLVEEGRLVDLVVTGLPNENLTTFLICIREYAPGSTIDDRCALLPGIDEGDAEILPVDEMEGSVIETVFRRRIASSLAVPEVNVDPVIQDCNGGCWLHIVDIELTPEPIVTSLAAYPLRFT